MPQDPGSVHQAMRQPGILAYRLSQTKSRDVVRCATEEPLADNPGGHRDNAGPVVIQIDCL